MQHRDKSNKQIIKPVNNHLENRYIYFKISIFSKLKLRILAPGYYRFEQALRLHDPDVTLPYWDSTLDQDLPEPNEAIIWVKELLGNNDGEVNVGPFAYWKSTKICRNIGHNLVRDAAFNPNASALLYSVRDVNVSFFNLRFP